MLRARVKSLEEGATRLRAELRDARAAQRVATSEIAELRAKPAEPDPASGMVGFERMQAKLTEMTKALEERTRECEGLKLQLDGGGVVQTMKARLEAAEADLTRLVAEREKLMEISNMLRADLNRVLTESFATPNPQVAAERAEREVATRYEAKLSQIEISMKQLLGQNKALKDDSRTLDSTDRGLDQNLAQLETNRSRLGKQLQTMRSSKCWTFLMVAIVIALFVFTYLFIKLVPKPRRR